MALDWVKNMKSKWHTVINALLAITGLVFAVICFVYADLPDDTNKLIKGILVSIWLVLPPAYFFVEWVFLYKESTEYPLEKFQYSQKLAKDFWFAVTIVLIALYFNGFEFNK